MNFNIFYIYLVCVFLCNVFSSQTGQVIPAIFSVPESSSGVNCTTVQAASSLTPSAVIGSNNSTTVAINRMAVSHSQVENSLTTGSNIQKTAYIPVVGSVNLNHLQMQSVNVVTDKRRIGGASASSRVSGATTANTYQQTAESQTDKSSHTADNTSEESEVRLGISNGVLDYFKAFVKCYVGENFYKYTQPSI